jgi:hypothetical protein
VPEIIPVYVLFSFSVLLIPGIESPGSSDGARIIFVALWVYDLVGITIAFGNAHDKFFLPERILQVRVITSYALGTVPIV